MKYTLIISCSLLMLFFSLNISAQQMTDYTGQVFPVNHALNVPIDKLPVHPNSINYINSIGATRSLHPDFGSYWDDDGVMRPMGIPYNVVGAGQPFVNITFMWWPEESDPGPWPIPSNPYIEGVTDWRTESDGDRHLLVVDAEHEMLYESGNVFGNDDGTEWEGGCGAVFNLKSNALRPDSWTSSDAAGLPIFPLLIRYDEVERALAGDGLFHHPIRFTASKTQKAYIWPARHYASSNTDPNLPPMGLRFRLKENYDISGFSPRMKVILRSMKKYGMIVADNGSNWFFQGTHDDRWDDEEINTLKNLKGSDFEAVDISEWMKRPGFDPDYATVPEVTGSKSIRNNMDVILLHNFPNPAHSSTIIAYNLYKSNNIIIEIYDILGREVITLVNENQKEGLHSVQWNGTNNSGQNVINGIYFFHIKSSSGNSITRKIVYNRE